ncbi:putative Nucleoside diphosphate kinase 7 [Blattamonas nauphoetae]|uniref:Nucleoside diphosphate kinase 7 n=1 Tax=Blattamonas nauphoetae TaxID=2049346 RepID=A0ABQ9XXD4_9EUKA|nr:putative Nucleoside diphosphate kinase 7 [Blattamonas nauphoetae]
MSSQRGDDDMKYTFNAEWFDPLASLAKPFLISYFPSNKTAEIFDLKNHRLFLKRSLCENLSLDQFKLGNTVEIYSRAFKLLDYADPFTKSSFEVQKERCCVIIKSEAFDYIGQIYSAFERENLTVAQLRTFRLNVNQLDELFIALSDHPQFEDLLNHLSNDIIVAIDIVGDRCLTHINNLLGPEDPEKARRTAPNSIRAKFGVDWVHNGVYASYDAEETNHMLSFLFASLWPCTAIKTNCTFALILPHVLRNKQLGNVLRDIIEEEGFDVSAMELFILPKKCADDFFRVYHGIWRDYSAKIDEVCSGPCLGLEIRGENAQKTFRQFCGPYDPAIAKLLAPNSLRALYGENRTRNGIHCTDVVEDTVLECEYFFDFLQV